MAAQDNLNQKQFYHGTNVPRSPGEHLTTGQTQNFGIPGRATMNYFTESQASAQKYANYAAHTRGGDPHVYTVQPEHPESEWHDAGGRIGSGEYTDREYGTKGKLRVLGESPQLNIGPNPASWDQDVRLYVPAM